MDYNAASCLVRYCHISGKIFWNVNRRGRLAGSEAGRISQKGYIQISLYGRRYSAHRVAWLLYYGNWPKNFIDHINLNKSDNRICNLREATGSQNQHNRLAQHNNTSGYKGVSFNKFAKKWVAYIGDKGIRHHIGYFQTAEEAHLAYCRVAKDKHKGFMNDGINDKG